VWLYHVNHWGGQVLRPYWRLGLDGATREIPRRGPLIIASNHQSFLDPWFIGIAFPRPIRYLMTSAWYDRSAAWRAVFRAFGTEPVRDGAGRTIEAVCRILERGEVVGVFPEGRVSDDGSLRPFRRGIALMAARSQAPVLPVAIRGSYDALPRHARIPRPRRVRVRLGRTMRPPTTERSPTPESATQFVTDLRDEIERLLA
jgi:1-acyl-sn-glycerol-3-phosphate acyltransferase